MTHGFPRRRLRDQGLVQSSVARVVSDGLLFFLQVEG